MNLILSAKWSLENSKHVINNRQHFNFSKVSKMKFDVTTTPFARLKATVKVDSFFKWHLENISLIFIFQKYKNSEISLKCCSKFDDNFLNIKLCSKFDDNFLNMTCCNKILMIYPWRGAKKYNNAGPAGTGGSEKVKSSNDDDTLRDGS